MSNREVVFLSCARTAIGSGQSIAAIVERL